ncbi:MAG: hypothetical protein KAR42_16810 [candidate division Zixibacteria bacterium]|nr:hypothetical protein [candidate division Zixibacteria bacterium]
MKIKMKVIFSPFWKEILVEKSFTLANLKFEWQSGRLLICLTILGNDIMLKF